MGKRADKLETVHLTTPVSDEQIAQLKIGQVVYIDGLIYTAREGVYTRYLETGDRPPIDFTQLTNVNFHCAPAAAARPGGTYEVGAVTATASFRFAKYLDEWLSKTGTRIIIGKGGMSQDDYHRLLVPNKTVYLTTVGYGTGALLGRCISGVRGVNWLGELGIAQAMWILECKRFGPLLVESDIEGNSLFEQNNARLSERVAGLYEGLKPPLLRRYGETRDKTDELI